MSPVIALTLGLEALSGLWHRWSLAKSQQSHWTDGAETGVPENWCREFLDQSHGEKKTLKRRTQEIWTEVFCIICWILSCTCVGGHWEKNYSGKKYYKEIVSCIMARPHTVLGTIQILSAYNGKISLNKAFSRDLKMLQLSSTVLYSPRERLCCRDSNRAWKHTLKILADSQLDSLPAGTT